MSRLSFAAKHCKTRLDDTTHEQTIICRQLFAGHVVGCRPCNGREEFENAASFLRSGLLSTLIRHENGAFRKRSSNRRNLKTSALHFNVDRKCFESGGTLRQQCSPGNLVLSQSKAQFRRRASAVPN